MPPGSRLNWERREVRDLLLVRLQVGRSIGCGECAPLCFSLSSNGPRLPSM